MRDTCSAVGQYGLGCWNFIVRVFEAANCHPSVPDAGYEWSVTSRHFHTLTFPIASVFSTGIYDALTMEKLRSFDT